MQKILTEPSSSKETIFYNWGILQDDELLGLVTDQKDIKTQKELAIELLYVQHRILKSNANRSDKSIDVKTEIENIKGNNN